MEITKCFLCDGKMTKIKEARDGKEKIFVSCNNKKCDDYDELYYPEIEVEE